MPDRTYDLIHNVGGNASANLDSLIAKYTQLNALLDVVNPKVRGLGKGSSAGVNALVKALGELNAGLSAANSGATNVAGAVQRVGSSAASAARTVGAASAATQGLGRSMGTGAKNAQTMAHGLNLAAAGAAGLTPQLARASAAAVGLKGSIGGISASTRGASSAMGGFTARMVALQASRAAFHAILEESKQLEDQWKKLAEEAGEFRESLRELASMRGKQGVDDNLTADVLDLALNARMLPAKAQELSTSFENFGPAIMAKGNFAPAQGTPEQLKADALAETGKTARRLGVGEQEAGGALGVAGMIHKFTSVEGAMEQVGGALAGIARGSTSYSAGLKALNVAAAKLVDPTEEDKAETAAEGGSGAGKLGGYAEAATMFGVMSLSTGGRAFPAGHAMTQISTALNPSAEYHGGAPAAALKEAGIEGKALPEQLIGITEYLKAKKVADTHKWLEEHGVGTDATRRVLDAQMKQAPLLKKWLAEQRESEKTNATGKKTIGDNTAFGATDRTAEAGAIAAIEDVTDKAKGIREEEQYEKAKRFAEQRVRAGMGEAKYDTVSRKIMLGIASIYTYPTKGVSALAAAQEAGALSRLRKEGKRVGVDVDKMFPKGELESGVYPTRAAAFTAASDEVKAKGGDPLGVEGGLKTARDRVKAIRPGVPAQRPAAALPGLGGGPLAGPQAFSAPGGGGFDPELNRLNRRQVSLLERIDRNLRPSGGGGGGSFGGDLRADGGDFNPLRT